MTTPLAVVTGATGFVATRLVPALLDAGWSVRATARRSRPGWLHPAVEYQAVDLAGEDSGAVSDLCRRATHVFHLAGASSSTSSQEEMDRNNAGATAQLLRAAAGAPLERFVHMSSTSVYGEEVQLPSPVTEDVGPRPSRGYGKAKWAAEQAVWEHADKGVPVVVLRPVSVYGPGAVKLLASAILDTAIERTAGLPRLALADEPLEQRLVHVDDLVAACLHVATLEEAAGLAFNVVDGIYPTSHEVGRILAGCFGMGVEIGGEGLSEERRRRVWEQMVARGMEKAILFTPERLRLMAKTNRNNRVSTDALTSTGFRFSHTDFPAAVEANVEWYLANRWLL